jgi:V8-like Glu-specific endopeptidase
MAMNACGRGAHRARRRVGSSAVSTLLALLTSLAVLVGVASADTVSRTGAEEAAAFWTPARMRAAKPLDPQLEAPSSITFDGPLVPAGETPHVTPPLGPVATASASSAFETVPDPTIPGFRENGAIFIETPFGLGRCSGTSVNAPNFSVVFTAAHCIHSGGPRGRWMDFRWAFVPGYRYGQRPFGVFPAKWIDTTRPWRTVGSENYDVGAAVVERNERGQLLGKAVGGAGIAWGLKAKQVFDVHGYPVEEPFDGETQQICLKTPFLGHDARSFVSAGPLNLAVDCDVTGGASGGGWTIRDGILNSVTNYGYGDDPDTDFGPYFGKEVARLYHRAASIR